VRKQKEQQMSYLLGDSGDSMGDQLGAYMGEGMDGYVGDGMDGGYVGDGGEFAGRRQRGQQQQGHLQQMLQPLPIPETVLTLGQTTDIAAYPQRGFRPHRLVIPSTISIFFKVNDIKVGQETQYVSSGTIYGECFSEVAVGVTLKGTRASLGNNIILNVTNRDAVNSQTFSAMLLGFTEQT